MFETVKNELSNFGAVDKKIKHDPNIPFGKNNYSHIFLNIGIKEVHLKQHLN